MDTRRANSAFASFQLNKGNVVGTNTVFVQGALGGGGYAAGLAIASDASSMLMRSDTANLYRFNPVASKWQNVSVSPNMDAVGVKALIVTSVHEIAYAPSDPNRAYAIMLYLPSILGSNGQRSPKWALFRSNDKGVAWNQTSLVAFSGYDGELCKYTGPRMAVDPHNPDICYAMALPGVVYVTYNGWANYSRVDALLAALPSATATANATDGGNGPVTVGSNPIAGNTYEQYAAYDATHELALGTNGASDFVLTGSGATTFNSSPIGTLQSYNGTPGAGSVRNGDTIYFGVAGGVQIDGSTGTVANPGIALGVSGAAGVASNVIYFSWMAGASSLWWSQDGGSTFAAMAGGGPSFVDGKMYLSNDAALGGGGNNVLYCAQKSTTTTGYYRWVKTKPTGSSLTNNTWTHLSISQTNGCPVAAPDPTRQGYVAFINNRGEIFLSNDYGATAGTTSGVAAQVSGNGGTDAPWLSTGVDGVFMGDAQFDPVTSGKLWLLDGNGVWYATPTLTYSGALTWTSQSDDMQSMTLNRLRKAPSPNGRILLGGQDHLFFSVATPTTPVASCYPAATTVVNAGDIIYSDSDPTTCFGSGSVDVYLSSDSGLTWAQITGAGLHGWRSIVWPVLAAISPTKVVAVGTGYNAQVGNLSGGVWTWSDCLVGGSAFIVNSAGSGLGPTKIMDSDGAGNIYLYDSGSTPAKLYKSTDGGSNFTVVSNPTFGALSNGGILRCVPGVSGHLFCALGVNGSNPIIGSSKLQRSIDSGVTWDPFSTTNSSGTGATYDVWGVAVGMAKPAASYPAIYIVGSLDGDQNNCCMFRSDDMPASGATSALRTTCTWTRLGNLAKANCERYYGGMDADMAVYGDVYMASGSSGYVYGKLQ